MNVTAYALHPFDATVTDGVDYSFWLHDLPDNDEKLQAQALAASGDYFEMLASELEQVAAVLPIHSMEQYQLQYYITQLIYLQHHYRIVKK
jgi:hypothetical protein